MKRLVKQFPFSSLCIVSLLGGALWRLEVEYHGWGGLVWLSYDHYAIPLMYLLFILWANTFIVAGLGHRIILNITAIGYYFLIVFLVENSLTYFFATGPAAFFLLLQTPKWLWYGQAYSVFVIVPLIPVGVYRILRWYHQFMDKKYLLLSILGMLVSVPLSIALLHLVKDKGSPDFIHCFKTGIIFPLWIFSIGLLLVGVRRFFGPPATLVDAVSATGSSIDK